MLRKNVATYYPSLKFMVTLCLPLIFMRFLESLNEFIATIMISHLGELNLASMALVMRFYGALITLVLGAFSIVSTLVARHLGENNKKFIADLFIQSVFLSILVSIPLSLIILKGEAILLFFGQDKGIVANCIPYLKAMSLAVLPNLLYFNLIQIVIGLGDTRYAFLNTLIFITLNTFFYYTFIFGNFLSPPLGLAGVGYGTVATFLTSSATIFLFLLGKYGKEYLLGGDWKGISHMSNIIRVGTPLGLLAVIEMMFMLWVALTIGRLGDVTVLAAYQITLQWFEVSIHCLYGITQGISICVSLHLGRGNLNQASRYSYIGLALAILIMLVTGFLYLTFPSLFISLFVKGGEQKNLSLISAILSLLPLVAVYQLAESIRLPALTTLRGLQDTRYALYGVALGYLGVSFPLIYFLTPYYSHKLEFMWVSIILGSLGSGVFLHYRAYQKLHLKFH